MLVIENFDIKNSTSFKIGGQVKKIFAPDTIENFVEYLKAYPEAPVLGNLSNILISSKGYDGIVILTSQLNKIDFSENRIVAGAGVRGPKLSQEACKNGYSGFEFMIGFPGSVGGQVFMNAGAHGQTISNIVSKVKVYHPQKGIITLTKDEMDFGYRTSICQKENLVVLEAEFELHPKSKEEIQSKMDENLKFRKSHQPSLALPNCGSVFKNPQGDSAGRLLDACGVKELKFGGVRVWENHANFIINDGNGTSTDVLNLMCEMKKRVKERFDIDLKPEVRYLGNCEEEVELCKILFQE